MSSPLQPIGGQDSPTTSAMVKARLQDAIMTGWLAPGVRLVQEELCHQLDVSRQPVREALQALQAEGLITQRGRGGGYAVRIFTEEEIRENYELRTLLESRAAAQAAEHITQVFLQRLEAANCRIVGASESGDEAGVLESNRLFHGLIWEQAKRPQQAAIIGQLWCSVTTFTPLLLPDHAKVSVQEHDRIVAALRVRDPVRARETMVMHIARAAADFEALRAG